MKNVKFYFFESISKNMNVSILATLLDLRAHIDEKNGTQKCVIDVLSRTFFNVFKNKINLYVTFTR